MRVARGRAARDASGSAARARWWRSASRTRWRGGYAEAVSAARGQRLRRGPAAGRRPRRRVPRGHDRARARGARGLAAGGHPARFESTAGAGRARPERPRGGRAGGRGAGRVLPRHLQRERARRAQARGHRPAPDRGRRPRGVRDRGERRGARARGARSRSTRRSASTGIPSTTGEVAAEAPGVDMGAGARRAARRVRARTRAGAGRAGRADARAGAPPRGGAPRAGRRVGLAIFLRYGILYQFGDRSQPFKDYAVQTEALLEIGPVDLIPKDVVDHRRQHARAGRRRDGPAPHQARQGDAGRRRQPGPRRVDRHRRQPHHHDRLVHRRRARHARRRLRGAVRAGQLVDGQPAAAARVRRRHARRPRHRLRRDGRQPRRRRSWSYMSTLWHRPGAEERRRPRSS